MVLDLDETLVCAYETSSLPVIVRNQAIEAGLKWFELECISSDKVTMFICYTLIIVVCVMHEQYRGILEGSITCRGISLEGSFCLAFGNCCVCVCFGGGVLSFVYTIRVLAFGRRVWPLESQIVLVEYSNSCLF